MNTLDIMNKKVLANILSLINDSNLTDIDFCNKIGYGVKTIDNWKRGVSKSYMKKIDEIANYFNVSTDYLLGNIDAREEYNRKLNKLGEDSLNSDECKKSNETFISDIEEISNIKEIRPSANETDERILRLASQFKDAENLFDLFAQLSPERQKISLDLIQALAAEQQQSQKQEK